MFFEVKPVGFVCPPTPVNQVYLIKDNWNDWFDYKTLFTLVYVSDKGQMHNIGGVKIGHFNMEIDPVVAVSPPLPDSFDKLEQDFFSLGQDVGYYRKLYDLGENIRYKILSGLKDVALDEELFEAALHEDVMDRSLLRGVSRSSVKGQYRRLANGNASLTRYKFKYIAPTDEKVSEQPMELSFEVKPKSNPPTNLHVLIGRNGVGKTYLIDNMIKSLVLQETEKDNNGKFLTELQDEEQELFANLVSVSFSAFDTSEPLPEGQHNSSGMVYSYVGLQQTRRLQDQQRVTKNLNILGDELFESLRVIRMGAKIARWTRAVKMLESDPIFQSIGIINLSIMKSRKEVKKVFEYLSSGHKIVLLTITKLVEKVEERTLVILDEPEAHLHPPLLSAFTRALSDLLIHRNGAAIIATHSPVMLQEVPKSCVWILQRSGRIVTVDRPEIETFGENMGTLTREVFGLEVKQSGFHKLLLDAVESEDDFNSILSLFNQELGMEARAILRALIANRK